MYNKKMNFNNKILNDLISKDIKTSKFAAQKLINDNNFEAYRELCEKSEFIFDFIKEKINRNLRDSVNIKNFNNLFNFLKIYSDDFSDFILESFLKFANNELTDDILELLQNGTEDEKCHATRYFSEILDPLSLEFIKNNLKNGNETLKQLSVFALKAHGEKDELNKAKENLHSKTPKEQLDAYNFIITYGDKDSFEDLFNFIKESEYKTEICQDILYLSGLLEIKEEYGNQYSSAIFSEILEGLPEIIELNEFNVGEINYYADYLLNSNLDYINAPDIIKLKQKMKLISENDVYTYDLDKNTKRILNEIISKCENKNDEYYSKNINLIKENFEKYTNIGNILGIIKELNNKNFAEDIKKLINTSNKTWIICKCAEILKEFNELKNINPDEIISKLETESAKNLIRAYYSEI